MKRVGKMLKKEYEAADSLARVIRDAVSDGEQFRRASAVASDGSPIKAVDFKCVGEAVKALKAVEELKRSITCTKADSSPALGIIEIDRRDGGGGD